MQVFFMPIFMKSYAFMNFEIAKKQHVSRFTYFLSLYILLYIIVFSSAFVFNFSVKYTILALILCSLHLIYIQYCYCYQMHFVKGKFCGEVIFSKQSIQLPTIVFPIKNIKTLELIATDFVYKYNTSVFHPRLSIGINNQLIITTIDNQTHHYLFQQKHDNELVKMEKILLHYKENNLLSSSNFYQIIGRELLY